MKEPYAQTFSFTYSHPDTKVYSVIVEVEVEPKQESNKHLAASDWDTQDNVMITDLVVQDEEGKVVDIEIPDEVLLHEWELEQHIKSVMSDEENIWDNW